VSFQSHTCPSQVTLGAFSKQVSVSQDGKNSSDVLEMFLLCSTIDEDTIQIITKDSFPVNTYYFFICRPGRQMQNPDALSQKPRTEEDILDMLLTKEGMLNPLWRSRSPPRKPNTNLCSSHSTPRLASQGTAQLFIKHVLPRPLKSPQL
jgi:hypothetical protein